MSAVSHGYADDDNILIRNGFIGLASLAPSGEVKSRLGRLSQWLPEPGQPGFDSPLLSGLADDISGLQTAPLESVTLPAVRLGIGTSLPVRCNIVITWDGKRREYAVLTTLDNQDRPIDHWVVQQKREQRLLEEKIVAASRDLERMNKALRQFASFAAHDLRAPLRQITTLSSLLLNKRLTSTEEVLDAVATIEACSSRLDRMVSGLLDMARLNSEQFAFEAVDLNVLLQDVLHNLGFEIMESDTSIDIGQLPTVEGSRSLITNLFQNLIGNSIRHRGRKQVRISIAHVVEAGAIDRIIVADDGPGIPAQYADAIFESFVRLSPTKQSGVGLGLSICRSIAELHRWRMCLDQNTPGGARFFIDLANVQRSK